MKIGKAGYRISCLNRSADANVLNIRPIGFKAETREASISIKARVFGAEIDDLNNDGFPDLIFLLRMLQVKKVFSQFILKTTKELHLFTFQIF